MGWTDLSNRGQLNSGQERQQKSEMERKVLALQHKIKELSDRVARLEILLVRLK